MSENEGPDSGVSAPEEGVFSEPTPVELSPSIMDEISGMATITPGAEPPTDYKAPTPKMLEEEMHFPKPMELETGPTATIDNAKPLSTDTASVEPAVADPATATPTRSYSQEEYDALMNLVAQQLTAPMNQGQPQAQNQGAPVAQTIPVPNPVAAAAPVQPPQAPRAYITPENHEQFLTDPDYANNLILTVANDIYQQAMLNTVPVAINSSRHEVQTQNMIADFWRANQDLTGIPPAIIGTLANQLQQETGLGNFEVYQKLGDYARQKLGRAKAAAAAAPPVPKFAPRPSAAGVAAPANRPARQTVADELRELQTLTTQFM